MFVDPVDTRSVSWAVIAPPLGDAHEHAVYRSLVPGVEPRRFPSIVVPRVVTADTIASWLGLGDLTALDFAALSALCDGGHGARNCTFDSMSTQLALDRLIRMFQSLEGDDTAHPWSSSVYVRMAAHHTSLRAYIQVAEKVFEWEERLLDARDEWISATVPMYSHQADAAWLALVRDKLSLEEFRSALLELKGVMDMVPDTGIPAELAQELLTYDWQRGCLTKVSPVRDEPSGL